MKLAFFSLFLLLLLSSTFAQTPATTPKSPAKPIPAAPAKPLVPTFPQSPSSNTLNSSTDNIIKILRKAKSFNVLIRLLKTTQLINQINARLLTTKSGGLTILAPDDGAFSALKARFLNSVDDGPKIELLQFHIFPIYVSSSNFDSLSNLVRTLVGVDPVRLQLNVTTYGNNVNISTGVVNATVTGIVYTDKQLAIYHGDKVLLLLDFFRPKPPASAPTLAKAPKVDKDRESEDDDEKGTCKNWHRGKKRREEFENIFFIQSTTVEHSASSEPTPFHLTWR